MNTPISRPDEQTLAAECLYELYLPEEILLDETLDDLLASFPDLSPQDARSAQWLAALWHRACGHVMH